MQRFGFVINFNCNIWVRIGVYETESFLQTLDVCYPNNYVSHISKMMQIFFQSISTNTAINGPSFFINCENYRHSCDTSSDQHNGCSDPVNDEDICPQ